MPDISITLSDSIESSPNSFSQTISAVKIDTQKYVNSQPYISDLSKMFLRKDMQDTANAPITFKKQIVFGESILSENFKSGSVNGYGLGIYKDAKGLYTIELDRVLVRQGIFGEAGGNIPASKDAVTTNTDQTITGIKDFSNGFKIGGVSVNYNPDIKAFEFPTNAIFGDIDLLATFNKKADKATTLEGYGIKDAVDLSSKQSIGGVKTFVDGLRIGKGDKAPLVSFREINGHAVLSFPCDVVFEGGVAWNSSIDGFDPKTITESILYDPMTLTIENGRLKVIGGGGSGTTSGITQEQLQSYLVANKYITQPTLADALTPYAKTDVVNSLLTEYLPKSGGAVSGNVDFSKGLTVNMIAHGNANISFVNQNGVGKLVFVKDDDWRVVNEDFTINRKILHSGNVADYALPITGGTVNGNVAIGSADSSGIGAKLYVNGSTYINSYLALANNNGVYFKDSGGTIRSQLYVAPDNNVSIGYGAVETSAFTSIYGTNIRFLISPTKEIMRIASSGDNSLLVFGNTKVDGYITTQGFTLSTSGTSLMTFDANGSVAKVGYEVGYGAILQNYNGGAYILLRDNNTAGINVPLNVNGNVTAPKFIGALEGNADSATNADMLDDKHLSDIPYARFSGGGLGTSEESGRSASLSRTMFFRDNDEVCGDGTEKGIIGYNVLHSLADTYGMQLVTAYADSMYFVRTKIGGEWGKWRKLATTEDNVASATKLATPRKIWGREFDGTKDIALSPMFPEFINLNRNGDTGEILKPEWLGFEIQVYSDNVALKTYSADGSNDRNLLLHKGGSVSVAGRLSIGSTTADERLHVHGNILATGNVSAQSVIINGKAISYNASKNAFVLPANLLVEGGIAWNSRLEDFTEDEIFTITKAVSIDGTSIIRDGGVLRVNPDYVQSVGGLDESELANYLTNNKYITEPNVNSLLTEYLPKSGGTINGDLTLNSQGSNMPLRVLKFTKSNGNVSAGEILFQSAEMNGLRIASVYGDYASRQDLVIYTSNNITSPYKPIWEPSLTVKHTGNVAIGGTTADEKLHVYGNAKATKFIGALEGNADSAYRSTFSYKLGNVHGSSADYAITYFAGQKPNNTTPTADNIYLGSDASWSVLSSPYSDGTTSAQNLMSMRLAWNNNFWHEIATSPNAENKLWHRSINSGTARDWQLILDSANYGNYALPITGGTVNGDITATGNVNAQIFNGKHNGEIYINNSGGDAYLPLIFTNSSVAGSPRYNYLFTAQNVAVGINPYRGTLIANSFIGALQGNADSATNADMLDDKHLSDIPYARFSGGGLGTSEESGRSASLSRTMFFRDNDEVCGDGTEKGIIGYNVLHSLADTYGMQLVTAYADSMYFVRTKIGGEWGKWRKLATTEDNVASATKLATPRKIWGREFDGTKDIALSPMFPEFINLNRNGDTGEILKPEWLGFEIQVYSDNVALKTYSADGSNDRNLLLHKGGSVSVAGRLSIGSTTADERLHVHGNILATGNVSAQNVTATTNVTATNALIAGGTAYASALKSKSICIECDENGGYDSKYEGKINCFDGSLWIQTSSGEDLYLGGSYANTTIRSTLEVNKAATFEGVLTAKTQMMVGSDEAPTQALEVRGNILATGRIAWNSSRVLKNIIGERYLTLDELAQIKPYRYKWKDGRDNLVHAGAIADEVMEIVPETVLTDSLGIHSMDYAQTAFVMAASLTPHVSDLKSRIESLEEGNVALKRENEALRKEIEKLKRVA